MLQLYRFVLLVLFMCVLLFMFVYVYSLVLFVMLVVVFLGGGRKPLLRTNIADFWFEVEVTIPRACTVLRMCISACPSFRNM